MREDDKQVHFLEGTVGFEVLASSKEEATAILRQNLVFRLGNDIEAGVIRLTNGGVETPEATVIYGWDAGDEVHIFGTNINQLRSY